jgi:SAM-dependent methyltransferase
MTLDSFAPSRQCAICGTSERIKDAEPIWPTNWQCSACGNSVKSADGVPMFAPELADTVTGFNPKVFDELFAVEDKHFWFVARNELITGLAAKFFPNARRLLEIGCGNGTVLSALTATRNWDFVVGSELHSSALKHARNRLPDTVQLVQMDATNIPAKGVFDLTGAFDVIEHIPDDEAVLRSLRGATQEGGGTIISVPQHSWLWSTADDDARHQRRYNLGELEEKLRRNGFDIIFSSSFTAVLLPLMALSRTKAKTDKAKTRFRRELQISPVANLVLKTMLRGETKMTLAGFRWPAGGSRIVVGRAV